MATFYRKLFIFLLLFLLGALPIIASNQCSDPQGECLFSCLDVRDFIHRLQELWNYYATLLLASDPGKWHPDYGSYGLSWKALVIVVFINILFLIFFWQKIVKTFNFTHKEERRELLKKLRAERSKVQQMEEKIKTIEQDLAVLKTEKAQVELEARVLQQELDKKGAHQKMQNAPQQTAESLACSEGESKVKELLKSHKKKILEMEQDHKKAEDLLKMQMEYHKRQAEENRTNTLVAEHALAAERKETADLRQKVIEVTTQLTEIQQPVFVPPPAKDGKTWGKSALEGDGKSYEEKLQVEQKNCKELEERIKKMEYDQSFLESEKSHLENLNKTLKEEVQILNLLCQQKDSALQQKLAEEQVDQCVKEIKGAGPKGEIRHFKQKIQDINEKNEKVQAALKNQITQQKKKAQDNWIVACSSQRALVLEKKETASLSKRLSKVSANLAGFQDPLFSTCSTCSGRGASKTAGSNVDELIAKVIKEEQSKHEETRRTSELKSQQLEEKIKTLEEDRDGQKNEKLKLQVQISTLQRKLSNLSELCEKKDLVIQQKSAQVDSERREKDFKVKEVLRCHRQKIQAIETQREKMALSFISEIDALKKKKPLVKAVPTGRPLTANKKEIRTPQNKSEVSSPPAEQGSQEKLYLEKLLAEEKKTQELIEKIRALQQDRDAVKDEKSQLEHQAAALQGKLQNMNEQCHLKEQALQQKVAQMESERRDSELKMKELVMSNKQNVQKIESDHQKTEMSYKAEIKSLQKKWHENLMKACASDCALTAHKKETANLCKQLDEVKAELADLQRLQSEPTPGCSYWVTTPVKKSRPVAQTLPDSSSDEWQEKLVKSAEELNVCLEKLRAEERKTWELAAKNQTLEQDRDAVKNEKSQLEQLTATLQNELQKMNDKCQQKEQDLQNMSAQLDSERCDKDIKLKEAFRSHRQNVQTIEEQHKKMELSYKAEIDSLQKTLQENLTNADHALTAHKTEVANLHKQLDEVKAELADLQRLQSEPTPGCSYWVTTPVKKSRPVAQTKLPNKSSHELDQLVYVVEEERNLYLKKLREEKKKTQELEALQVDLQKIIEVSQQQEQALQQKVMQMEAVLLEKDAEILHVLQAHSLRIREMEEDREKLQGAYLAQIEAEEKEENENSMKAKFTEKALAAERKMSANLQNKLDEVKAKLARFQRAVSEPVPGTSEQEMRPFGPDVEATESSSAGPNGSTIPQSWSFENMEDSPPSHSQRSFSASSIKGKGAGILNFLKRL